ncbi:MAG TPA: hemerythrin domain-containing protein [Ferruginibacter sp.]|nr:hemerythrin domain-containing protein [Ferruginibacter sp.]
MKRHEALAPLSREHHSTLILAQLLKNNAPEYKGLPVIPKEKATYAKQQFDKEIKKHFEQEELMLQKVKDCNPEIAELSVVIINEHEQLTALFLSLERAVDLEETMDELGRKLEEHIRKEERVLFPIIQQYCAEDKLQEISILLH